jgi:dihydrofolate reductase
VAPMRVHLIVAASDNDIIGAANALPWHLPADMRRFASLTRGHVIVMGRLTHESIVARLGHQLPGRRAVVISRRGLSPAVDGTELATSPEAAAIVATKISKELGTSEWFVIGGASVYQQLLDRVDVIELTRVHATVEGDTRMPPGWLDGFTPCSTEPGSDPATGLAYTFIRLERSSVI